MADMNTWHAMEYLSGLIEKNKLAQQEDFKTCRVSGWDNLEEITQNMRSAKAFFAVDDTAESALRENGGSYTRIKAHTVFLLRRYKTLDEQSRNEAIEICNKLMTQLIARMILDSDKLSHQMIYLDTEFNVREMGSVLNGLTGLYFTFSHSVPEDLQLNTDDWTDL